MAIIIMVGEERSLERALTTAEAQAVLRLGEKAFMRMVERGDITPYEERLGNYQLFLAREVEDLRQRRLKRF